MRKLMVSCVLCLLVNAALNAQAYEGKIEFDKKKQAAFVIELPYPPEAVANAFVQRMDKLGYRGREEKGLFNKDRGFRIYRNAYITAISDKKFDYIINVERKSRKEKDEAVLYLLVMDNDQNAISNFDAADMRRAKDFLNGLLPDVEAANLELEIRAQEEVVAKAEKKLRNLHDNKQEMEEKMRKLQKDIEDNVKDQEETRKDIENQKNILESLKLKRKG